MSWCLGPGADPHLTAFKRTGTQKFILDSSVGADGWLVLKCSIGGLTWVDDQPVDAEKEEREQGEKCRSDDESKFGHVVFSPRGFPAVL